MMKRDDIIEAYAYLRRHNMGIPDDALDFILNASLKAFDEMQAGSHLDAGHKLGDYDRWFKPCEKCGFDAGRVSEKSSSTCWKCGNRLQRDYSSRALKKIKGE